MGIGGKRTGAQVSMEPEATLGNATSNPSPGKYMTTQAMAMEEGQIRVTRLLTLLHSTLLSLWVLKKKKSIRRSVNVASLMRRL